MRNPSRNWVSSMVSKIIYYSFEGWLMSSSANVVWTSSGLYIVSVSRWCKHHFYPKFGVHWTICIKCAWKQTADCDLLYFRFTFLCERKLINSTRWTHYIIFLIPMRTEWIDICKNWFKINIQRWKKKTLMCAKNSIISFTLHLKPLPIPYSAHNVS